jgi:hypothetical protein
MTGQRAADIPTSRVPQGMLGASCAAFAALGTSGLRRTGAIASFFLSQVWGDLNDKAERMARRVGVDPK